MIGGNTNISVIKDQAKQLLESLRSLSNIDVLVGIPEENGSRQGDRITNAELAFIHTEGSPLKHIPSRPFLIPAISDPENQEMIAVELRKATEAAMGGNIEAMSAALVRVGMQGQNAVRDWFTNPKNNWPPSSPYTILEKLRKTAKLRTKDSVIARDIVRYVNEGGKLEDISGLEGMTQPLVDTDAMRKAITFVVRKK